MLIPLEIPPGLVRQNTPYSTARGRWYDANLIRFFEGQIRPIGGWITGLAGALTGTARAAHAWKDNDGASWAMFGTHTGLFTHDGTTLDDVTPTLADELLLEDGTDWLLEDGTAVLLEGFEAGDEDASTWTLDNFGELAIACNDTENMIMEWQPGGGIDALLIANSPYADAIFVTEERIIVALGADGDPRKVAWCDQENRTTWAATATNQAGNLILQTRGTIQCGRKIRGGGLIWTTEDLHLMRYVGFPDIYGIERVGDDCGIVGRHACMVVDTSAFWMGRNNFWVFRGYVDPIPCDISDDVFSNINTANRHKVWCLHIAEYGEVWFFYPRGDSTECSHAAIFNYREGHWNHTPMSRLCGFAEGVFDWPVMVRAGGAMLKHETGWVYEDALLLENGEDWLLEDGTAWLSEDGYGERSLQSGPVEIGTGERRLQIDEFIPDESTQGDCEVYFYTRAYPNAEEATLGPFNAADRVGVITTARQARIKIRSESGSEDFRVGTYRVSAKERGRY